MVVAMSSRTRSRAGTRPGPAVADFGPVSEALPSAPDPALDPYLDAAARCFARLGISRTSVPDIAREARVSRSTVYRLVGTVDDAAELLVLRELHDFLGEAPDLMVGGSGPDVVVDLVTAFTRRAAASPVVATLVRNEPSVASPRLVRGVPPAVDKAAAVVQSLLELLMDAGLVARRDPRILAGWVVRIVFAVLLAPPPGDLRAFYAEVLGSFLAT